MDTLRKKAVRVGLSVGITSAVLVGAVVAVVLKVFSK
jgi:hypothetical protein